MRIYIYIYTQIYIYNIHILKICAYIYIYICMYVCMYIHIYIYTYSMCILYIHILPKYNSEPTMPFSPHTNWDTHPSAPHVLVRHTPWDLHRYAAACEWAPHFQHKLLATEGIDDSGRWHWDPEASPVLNPVPMTKLQQNPSNGIPTIVFTSGGKKEHQPEETKERNLHSTNALASCCFNIACTAKIIKNWVNQP